MSTAYPERILLTLRAQLDGLEEELAASAVMDAWHDLARRSNCWQEQQSMPLPGGDVEYLPIAPSQTRAEINNVMWVDVDGWPVYFVVGERPFRKDMAGRIVDTGDTKAIRAAGISGNTLTYTISLVPRLSAFVSGDVLAWIPREMQDTFYEHILQGALALLCDMPTKPWYNPQRAQTTRRRFLALTTNAIARTRARNVFGAAMSTRFVNVGLSRRPFRG